MDKQTFAAQTAQMERSLYRVARGYLTDVTDCADAVQEALLKAWEHRGALREPLYFRTWLTRILINECQSILRRRGRTQAVDPDALPDPPATGAPPTLADALQALEPRDRAALVLHYLEGYSVRELAQLLHLPQGTVKCRLSRARQKLKNILQEEVTDDDEK